MPHLRPVRRDDDAALADVCLRTADFGSDATGLFDDDDIWGAVFARPYAERHPDHAFVVADDDDRAIGYVVATPDTDVFEEWFRSEWWPRFAERWPEPRPDDDSRQAGTLRYAYGRRAGAEPWAREYPAHLHIDLLPEAQGQGWGRRLIAQLLDRLAEGGVPRLHLVAAAGNAGALAFYDRLGFERLPSPKGVQAFGIDTARRRG
ncbi:GNAT family N-acetyltransferase [Microbacterium sp. cf332]|uniref:GNAT family N-acetyltransferase n=1 Tax=Microbacterium sp. cf332 TaxID=1761804 RepID=UPI0008837A3A|nr:GNAT family N-acetyltransferase [Microbacterium sp. cf332]SDQ23822.1 Acetyltransferase (GNAT) family protein [Microbacterium sp. cf332]